MAIPIFWMLDFISGLSAAKRRGEPITIDKINSQFIKFIIHIVFLIGCVVIANLFYVDSFLRAGFGYIIATEFLSMTRNLFGKKESVKIIRHFKKLLFETFGINLDNNENEKED